jgi:hypothetical protein
MIFLFACTTDLLVSAPVSSDRDLLGPGGLQAGPDLIF